MMGAGWRGDNTYSHKVTLPDCAKMSTRSDFTILGHRCWSDRAFFDIIEDVVQSATWYMQEDNSKLPPSNPVAVV
jgi:hypothetical protein